MRRADPALQQRRAGQPDGRPRAGRAYRPGPTAVGCTAAQGRQVVPRRQGARGVVRSQGRGDFWHFRPDRRRPYRAVAPDLWCRSRRQRRYRARPTAAGGKHRLAQGCSAGRYRADNRRPQRRGPAVDAVDQRQHCIGQPGRGIAGRRARWRSGKSLGRTPDPGHAHSQCRRAAGGG
ncbi:hypothetical protein D3C76_1332660 [compost metagenome]